MKRISLLTLFFITLLFTSCEKKEDSIKEKQSPVVEVDITTPQNSPYGYVEVETEGKVYEELDPSSSVLGTVQKGDKLPLATMEQPKMWLRVTYKGKEGFLIRVKGITLFEGQKR